MKREELETQAKKAVCSCWYYDLCNDIDATSDEDLAAIIANPAWCHIQNQSYNPQPWPDYLEELEDCPEWRDNMEKINVA